MATDSCLRSGAAPVAGLGFVLAVLASACVANPGGARATVPPGPVEVDAPGAEPAPPRILDVFFGLDDALPWNVLFLCPGAEGLDGIPVTFSHRAVDTQLPASSFRITTRSQASYTPRCATLRPANEASERHTVLLVGQLGSELDPPVRLDIVGPLLFDNGANAQGLSSTQVTPLPAGPSLLMGLRYAPAGLPGTECPAPATKQIVQVTWSGGVSAVGGGELGDAQRVRMHVTVSDPAGTSRRELIPFALADLGDNDNYVQLCLDDSAPAVSVRVEANVCADPRGDPNSETTTAVHPAE